MISLWSDYTSGSWGARGRDLSLLPVNSAIALQTAGATSDMVFSPIPEGTNPLDTIWTSSSGKSAFFCHLYLSKLLSASLPCRKVAAS